MLGQFEPDDLAGMTLLDDLARFITLPPCQYHLPRNVFLTLRSAIRPWDGTDSFRLGVKPQRMHQATIDLSPRHHPGNGIPRSLVKAISRKDSNG